ncbi:hypothetical protein SteCoe_31028 [Stentor coeruleus]|uniref:EF-hand domain-containing protein n=1 Tax=Stentor coeruleus TaxID=5963 RepID=A0A1R2B279_9CILI|nr:hypothetical protein SteCoe_31028 [Stentor coeruleus]
MGACAPKREEAPLPSATQIQMLSPQEKIIMQNESNYIFSRLNFKELSKSIKSESIDGSLSSSQLKRAFLDLEISLDELTSPESATFKLLSKVKNEKKLFEVRKLMLIAIFLGKGKASDKIEWLFRQYDIDASEVLEYNEFVTMTHEIFDVVSRILPAISIGEGVGSLTKEEYDEYSARIITGKDKAQMELTENFRVLESVRHDDFVKIMADDPKFKFLLSSTLVREYLRKYAD